MRSLNSPLSQVNARKERRTAHRRTVDVSRVERRLYGAGRGSPASRGPPEAIAFGLQPLRRNPMRPIVIALTLALFAPALRAQDPAVTNPGKYVVILENART